MIFYDILETFLKILQDDPAAKILVLLGEAGQLS